MKRELVTPIVDKWLKLLEPVTWRCEPAGSYRRGKEECKDLEIVCIPRTEPENDLFGNSGRERNLLELWFGTHNDGSLFHFNKNGTRYKQLVLLDGINLDLFIVRPPAQWGVQFTIRTGPADFSHWLVTSKHAGGALPTGCQVKDGAFWRDGELVPTPEESDFFHAVGLLWTEPKNRIAQWKR